MTAVIDIAVRPSEKRWNGLSRDTATREGALPPIPPTITIGGFSQRRNDDHSPTIPTIRAGIIMLSLACLEGLQFVQFVDCVDCLGRNRLTDSMLPVTLMVYRLLGGDAMEDNRLSPEDRFSFPEQEMSYDEFTQSEIEDEEEQAVFNHTGRMTQRENGAREKVRARVEGSC